MVLFLVVSTTLISFAPYIPVDNNPQLQSTGSGNILSPQGHQSLLPNIIPNLSLVKEAQASTNSGGSADTSFTLETRGLKLSGETKDFLGSETPEFSVDVKRNIFPKIGAWLMTSIGRKPKLPEVKVTMLDSYGRLVKGVQVKENGSDSVKVIIDPDSGLKSGAYTLVVQDGKGNGLLQDFSFRCQKELNP